MCVLLLLCYTYFLLFENKFMFSKDAFLSYISSLEADSDITRWSGYMPDKKLGNGALFYDLHPVIRALLIADGTVTMAIEAIYREEVEVRACEQGFLMLKEQIPLLGLSLGEEVFYREVELVGVRTGKSYVKAQSLLRRDSISVELWSQLKSERVGMGVVLRHTASNSYREVLHIGAGSLTSLESKSVHRTYSVKINSLPAILITEVFDLHCFESGYN